MLKPWAILALTTLAATSDDKWAYYKGEYTNKEGRCSRGTCDLGPHAYRGTQFQGPAWSVKIFFEDPQLIVESPWYNRIRRDALEDGDGEPVRFGDILHEGRAIEYTRKADVPLLVEEYGDAVSKQVTLPAKEHAEGCR